jgi:hypothetical protein
LYPALSIYEFVRGESYTHRETREAPLTCQHTEHTPCTQTTNQPNNQLYYTAKAQTLKTNKRTTSRRIVPSFTQLYGVLSYVDASGMVRYTHHTPLSPYHYCTPPHDVHISRIPLRSRSIPAVGFPDSPLRRLWQTLEETTTRTVQKAQRTTREPNGARPDPTHSTRFGTCAPSTSPQTPDPLWDTRSVRCCPPQYYLR